MRLAGIAAAAVLAAGLWSAAAMPAGADAGKRLPAEIDGNGIYTQSWFLDSFLDLTEDLAEATEGGKRFAIIWEQRGCPYCRETHVVNFGIPEIRGFIKDNFVVLQLNIHGSREVTDFDGETMSEAALATKYGVRYTPTVTFYKQAPQTVAAKGDALEITRMTGYYKPFHFLAAFQYVDEKGYQGGKFKTFVAAKRAERLAQGKTVTFR